MELFVLFEITFIQLLLFFLVSVPSFFGIRRGLFAVQGYLLYCRARSGVHVRIVRLRCRIITGKLLRGTPLYTTFFVFANVAVLTAIFFATWDIREEMRPFWAPVTHANITSLPTDSNSQARVAPRRNDNFQAQVFAHVFSCAERTRRGVAYWPVAFTYEIQSKGPNLKVDCQQQAPGIDPMLDIEYLRFHNADETFPEDKWNSFRSYVLNVTLSNIGRRMPQNATQYDIIRVEVEQLSQLQGAKGQLLLYSDTYCLFILQDSGDNIVITSGEVVGGFEEFNRFNSDHLECNVADPILIASTTNPNITSPSFRLLDAIRQDLTLQDIQYSMFNMPVLIEIIMKYALIHVPLATSNPSAYTEGSVKGTYIGPIALVLFPAIGILALLVGFIREFLACFLVHKRNITASQIFISEFDQLSTTLRREMETSKGVQYSSDFAVFGSRLDDYGQQSAGAVLPSDNQHEEELTVEQQPPNEAVERSSTK